MTDITAVKTVTWWSDEMRSVPNSMLRSALFAVVKRGERRFIKNEVIASVGGIQIKYRGEQLDQSDLTVFAQILNLSKCSVGENEIIFNTVDISAPDFLRGMGIATGGANVKCLVTTLTRLQGAVIEISHGKRAFSGQMLHNIRRDDKTKKYKIEINQELANLFSENGFTRLQLDQRTQLRGKPLDLWLHAFYSSHSDTDKFHFSVEKIRNMCGSSSTDLNGFKRDLLKAMENIKTAAGWKFFIEKDLIYLFKKPF